MSSQRHLPSDKMTSKMYNHLKSNKSSFRIKWHWHGSTGLFYSLYVFPTTITLIWYDHKWPRICSICCNHNSVLSSFVTYFWVCTKSNTMHTTSEAWTAYPSGAPEFTPGLPTLPEHLNSLLDCLPFRSTWIHSWTAYPSGAPGFTPGF